MAKKNIRQILKNCTKEGIVSSFMFTTIDYYLIPFALFLGASNKEIGLLVALPNLLGAFSLLAINLVAHFKSRLNFIKIGVLTQAIFLIPVAMLAITNLPNKVFILTLLIIVFKILMNLTGIAWGSLVSEYLLPGLRGKYFGFRSQLIGIATILSIFCSGVVLYIFKKIDIATGFFIIFSFIVCCRFLSFFYITKLMDIPNHHHSGHNLTFFMFLKSAKKNNYARFVFYVAAIAFATNIAAPFFSVYMLRDLHLSYLSYTAISISAIIGTLMFNPLWGSHADLVGNYKVIRITSFLMPFIPILWMFSKNPIYLLTIEFFSGFIWGGFNLCTVNFIYDAIRPAERLKYLAYFNLINGIAIFISALLGGFLVQYLPPICGFSILTLFLISSILRFLAFFLLSKNFTEVRKSIRSHSSIDIIYSMIGIKPIMGRGTITPIE